jgi:hypothetical protein
MEAKLEADYGAAGLALTQQMFSNISDMMAICRTIQLHLTLWGFGPESPAQTTAPTPIHPSHTPQKHATTTAHNTGPLVAPSKHFCLQELLDCCTFLTALPVCPFINCFSGINPSGSSWP